MKLPWRVKLGLLVWGGLMAASLTGGILLDPIARIYLLAPLVIVPLGWDIVFRGDKPTALRAGLLLQPWAAALATVSFFVPVGRMGGALALAWVGTVGLGAWGAVERFRLRKGCFSVDTVAEVGLLNLFVGSLWLMASRMGLEPMGFKEPIVFLTAVHFHYTGFAATIFTAALGRHLKTTETAGQRVFPVLAFGIVMGMPAVGAGFMFSPLLKVAAVMGLCVSLIGVATLTLLSLCAIPNLWSRALLGISAVSLLAGMALASIYGLGEYIHRPWLDILRMIHTHGILNALGFTLCGLMGWYLSDMKEAGHGTN